MSDKPADHNKAHTGPLGAGSEPLGASGGPSDPAVRTPAAASDRVPTPRESAETVPAVASGVSNYSSTSQYGNQGQYGTPAQYNEERLVGGEMQNGDHPEDRPGTGASGPAHPNG